MAIAGELFRVTGMCLCFMFIGKLGILGNTFFWNDSLSESQKFTLGTIAEYMIGAGILGLIKIMYEAIKNEFESLANARHALLVSASHETNWTLAGRQTSTDAVAQSGIGLRSMFLASDSSSSARWAKLVLSTDGLVDDEDLIHWCNNISRHEDARHIKYFAALLRRDTALAIEITGMRPLVVFRLQEALDADDESPWLSTALSLQNLSAKLDHNHIFMSARALKSIFNEIDEDSSGQITEQEFMSWMNDYRPKSGAQKRKHVLHTLIHSSGFWCLLAPVVGLFFIVGPGHLWPAAGVHGVSTATSTQVAFALFFVGAAENMRQAWRAQAYEFDEYEQAELELKSSIECITDALEATSAAARLAAAVAMAGAESVSSLRGDPPPEEVVMLEVHQAHPQLRASLDYRRQEDPIPQASAVHSMGSALIGSGAQSLGSGAKFLRTGVQFLGSTAASGVHVIGSKAASGAHVIGSKAASGAKALGLVDDVSGAAASDTPNRAVPNDADASAAAAEATVDDFMAEMSTDVPSASRKPTADEDGTL
jgi:hypothetical protein